MCSSVAEIKWPQDAIAVFFARPRRITLAVLLFKLPFFYRNLISEVCISDAKQQAIKNKGTTVNSISRL